jgi:hypothetical protein
VGFAGEGLVGEVIKEVAMDFGRLEGLAADDALNLDLVLIQFGDHKAKF